jgi:hypothetical protein
MQITSATARCRCCADVCFPRLARPLQVLRGGVVLRHADFWIYPAQTILRGALRIWFRRSYEFHRLKDVAFTR